MQWNGPVHRNRNITVTRDHKIVYKVYHLSFTVTEKVAARGHKNNIIQIIQGGFIIYSDSLPLNAITDLSK